MRSSLDGAAWAMVMTLFALVACAHGAAEAVGQAVSEEEAVVGAEEAVAVWEVRIALARPEVARDAAEGGLLNATLWVRNTSDTARRLEMAFPEARHLTWVVTDAEGRAWRLRYYSPGGPGGRRAMAPLAMEVAAGAEVAVAELHGVSAYALADDPDAPWQERLPAGRYTVAVEGIGVAGQRLGTAAVTLWVK